MGEEGRGEGSERAVVVVPPAPVVFCLSLELVGEVVEHSSDMALSFLNDVLQVFLWIAFDLTLGVAIDLLGEESSHFHHHLRQKLDIGLTILIVVYISGMSSTHLLVANSFFYFSVKYFSSSGGML